MKNKTTSSAIALPANIQPPPRKEDIINAMVERARVKHAEENQRLQAIRAAAQSKLESAVRKNLADHPENFTVEVRDYRQPAVTFEMVAVPPQIAKLKAELRECQSLRNFHDASVKRQIREGMNVAGDRVKSLLANPDAVKKLDAALKAITTP
jgi:CO dehydrogenase/acetyl-CoA synthase gamma subunit (corrinoid Fe-S protein)